MKINDLLESSQISSLSVISVLKKLKKFGLDFTVIGGAGLSLHTGISANDIDILLNYVPKNFFSSNKLNFYDYPLSPEGEGIPRHVRINGIPVHLIQHGDFKSDIQHAKIILVKGFHTLSLSDLIRFTVESKKVDKLEQLIRIKKLSMEWFKNLHHNDWRSYAIAWDSVHEIPIDEVERWKKLFDDVSKGLS